MATSKKVQDIIARARAAQGRVQARPQNQPRTQVMYSLPTVSKFEEIMVRLVRAHPEMGDEKALREDLIENDQTNKKGQGSLLAHLHVDQPVSRTVAIYRSGTVTAVNVDIETLLRNL